MKTSPKILVAPPFPEGEIINGFLARIQCYAGSTSLPLAAKRILNRTVFLDGMPSSIEIFHREVGHLYGTVDSLIDKHTEFHFIKCGLPQHRIEEQRQRLIYAHCGPVRLARLPLLFSPIEQTHKVCPVCAEEQSKKLGFTFIHRRMVAPFVNVCSIHGIQLLPTQLKLFEDGCQRQPNRYQLARSQEFANRVDLCMQSDIDCSSSKEDVVERLHDQKWIRESGTLYLKEFVEKFQAFFEGSFSDERLKHLCQTEDYIVNGLRALLREERAVHPVWCILFSWFSEQVTNAKGNSKSAPTVSKDAPRKDEFELTHDELNKLLELHSNVRSAAEVVSLSSYTFRKYCKRHGVNLNWRPKKLTGKSEVEIRHRFSNGESPIAIANDIGISVATIYRVIDAMPNKRELRECFRAQSLEGLKELWIQLLAEHSTLTRTQMRMKFPALFMRLYRADIAWIKVNQLNNPCPKARVRAHIDTHLTTILDESVKSGVAQCISNESRAQPTTDTKIQKLVGVSEYALKACIEKQTLHSKRVSKTEAFQMRITRGQRNAGRPLALNTLAKEAGIRPDTVRKLMGSEKE